MASTTTKLLLTDNSGNGRYLSLSFSGDVLEILDANSGKTLTVDMAATVSGSNTGDQTTISGNAGTATKLQTARNINGVSFDGSADITVADSTKIPTSYLDTDVTLAANSDAKIATQKAIKAYADQLIAAANATVYKGATDCSANPNYPAADAGWLYRVSVGGKIGGSSGKVVEAGDMFICLTDGTSSGNQATVGTNWNVIQTNIDGAVIGPTSATDLHIPVFDGVTGKLIKDSGAVLSDLATKTGSETLTNKILDQLRTAQTATAEDQIPPWGAAMNTHKVPIVLDGTTYYLHLTTS